MSLGRRKRKKQEAIWIDAAGVAGRGGHPLYERLNQLLENEISTASPDRRARRSIRGQGDRDFRRASTSGCCWSDISKVSIKSAALLGGRPDSLALRSFLGLELSDVPPDHTTISRTRRL